MTTLDKATGETLRREFQAVRHISLYDKPDRSTGLATQLAKGLHATLPPRSRRAAADRAAPLEVDLVADGYRAWLMPEDRAALAAAPQPWSRPVAPADAMPQSARAALAYAVAAGRTPNSYLWGGTVPPDYDCSGLVQAAFSSSGVWLPRDSPDQAAWVDRLPVDQLAPGDLLFFGDEVRVRHVGIVATSAGPGGHPAVTYIHSSGRDTGHNGIAVSALTTDPEAGTVATRLAARFHHGGRVTQSWAPETPLATWARFLGAAAAAAALLFLPWCDSRRVIVSHCTVWAHVMLAQRDATSPGRMPGCDTAGPVGCPPA